MRARMRITVLDTCKVKRVYVKFMKETLSDGGISNLKLDFVTYFNQSVFPHVLVKYNLFKIIIELALCCIA